MSEQNLAVKEETPMSAFGSIQAFESVQRMATMLAKSDMVPKQYQDNLPNCVIALEMANRMGASVFAVMQNLAIVHGKPSWEAKFIIGAINSCGRFSPLRFDISEEGPEEKIEGFYYQWDNSSRKNKRVPVPEKIRNRTCVAWAMDRSGERVESPPVSIKMAVQEGWYSKSDSKWKTMPEVMLRYRAASFFGKVYASDLLMGMQSAEEMRDVYDAEATTEGGAKIYSVKPQTEASSRTASVRDKLKSKAKKKTDPEQPLETSEPEPERNPQLVNAILQAITDSVTEDKLLEAEDLIRELENPEDKAKCEEALAQKRKVMAK